VLRAADALYAYYRQLLANPALPQHICLRGWRNAEEVSRRCNGSDRVD
jgi:hypothetical protein